jgi:lysosomal acid lipase/cholesteryl ester hydrolase
MLVHLLALTLVRCGAHDVQDDIAALVQSTNTFDEDAQGGLASPIHSSETIQEYLGKYGIPVEQHSTTTDDGYVLGIFRMPRPGAPALLLQHGILCSSWHWLINSPSIAPAIQLYYAGYDVWLTNSRGNTYSRKHARISPFSRDFWQFSFADMGRHDVPANIQYILEQTGRSSLTFLGWSQGTTQFFVSMTDARLKSYIERTVNLFVALAPVTWMQHQSSGLLATLTHLPYGFLEPLFPYGFATHKSSQKIICRLTGGRICKIGMGFVFGQSHLDTAAAILNFTAHFPAGVSAKDLIHYSQLIRSGRFCDYDYTTSGNATQNNDSSMFARDYDMASIMVPTALFISQNDDMGDVEDNNHLIQQIGTANPALVYKRVFPGFSHATYFTGTEAAFQTWFPDLQDLLQKYSLQNTLRPAFV